MTAHWQSLLLLAWTLALPAQVPPPTTNFPAQVPNDPLFSFNGGSNQVAFANGGYRNEYQWGIHNTGEPTSYYLSNQPPQFTESGAGDTQLARAWNIQAHATNITIALIDSMVPLHPDLPPMERVVIEPSTSAHGIHAAGIIAAIGNNGIGLAGTCRDGAKLLAIECLSYTGIGHAVEYAATNGAKIIHFPFGYPFPRVEWTNGFRLAFENGCLVVCSGREWAGQESADYPALWSGTWSNILAVGPFRRGEVFYGEVASHHPEFLHILADGRAVITTEAGGGYTYTGGSSPASERVAGVAALCWEKYPNETCFQIKERLMASADRRPGYEGKCASGGLNALAALNWVKPVLERRLLVERSDTVTGPWVAVWTNIFTSASDGEFFRLVVE